jgi:hypothetical protein
MKFDLLLTSVGDNCFRLDIGVSRSLTEKHNSSIFEKYSLFL